MSYLDAAAGDLRLSIQDTDLGPAEVGVLDGQLITVRLDSTVRITALRKWIDAMVVRDMVVGQYRRTDAEHRLNVRGWFSRDLYPVAIIAEFNNSAEPALVNLIYQRISDQEPRSLIDALAAAGA